MPVTFAEVQLMTVTRSSWEELQNTPYDVVQRLEIYLMVKNAIETGGSLTFDEDGNAAVQ